MQSLTPITLNEARTDEERAKDARSAALTVCQYATNTGEAKEFLQMLNLLDEES